MGWLGGKLTPVLQPTDTDVAFPLKAAATSCKHELRRELQEKARTYGVKATLHCGPYDMLRIGHESCEYLENHNLETNVRVASLRRNGSMVGRPNIKAGRMERCDGKPWDKLLSPRQS